jgi:hypothetical protein
MANFESIHQVKFNQPQDVNEALVMNKTRKTNIR